MRTIQIFIFLICISSLSVNEIAAQNINFKALFATHHDQVKTETIGTSVQKTLRLSTVELREITEAGETTYLAIDHSEKGAVGCLMHMVLWARQLAELCSDIGTKHEVETLDRRLASLYAYIARNTFPSVSVEAVETSVQKRLEPQANHTRKQCLTDEEPNMARAFDYLSGPDGARDIQDSLSIDRLPVTNPCL